MKQKLEMSLYVGVRGSAGSRGITPLPPLLRERYDAAGSAVDNAGGSAAGNAGTLPRRIQQQVGQQRHRLAALLLTQPREARLQQLDLSLLTQFISEPAEEPRSKWATGAIRLGRTFPLQRGHFAAPELTGQKELST